MVNIEWVKIGLSVTKEIKVENKLKIYIAGPMRGLPDSNSPAFYDAEKFLLNKKVWEPINPARLDLETQLTTEELVTTFDADEATFLKEAMKKDLEELFECDYVYMLQGWEKSYGARVEHALAVYLGLGVMYQG